MISISLRKLAKILNAELIGADKKIIDVIIDSRKITPNCLFVALKGKNFDSHNFITISTNATALLVSKRLLVNTPQLLVKDTKLSLGKLASWVRQQVPTQIVALTGSSGKTSVKEMTAAILKTSGNVLYTANNFNNDIGVPITLLRLKKQHNFAVLELGANHIGEIAYSVSLTKPQSVLINNLSPAHLEGFGSLEGISKAKSEIFNDLPSNGVVIINADNNDWFRWKNNLSTQTIWRFSLKNKMNVDFFASKIQINNKNIFFQLHSPFGCTQIVLPLLGKHNVSNALAATALAMSVGATLEGVYQGLKNLQAMPGRLFPILLMKNKLLLDDSYNANFGSMVAAIQVLSKMPGYQVMIVGDIDELGEASKEYHYKIGNIARLSGINKVISIGNFSRILSTASGKGEHYLDQLTLITRARELLSEHSIITILLKGSRNSKIDRIVRALQDKIQC
ncbi:UDP-N-acetylmuramoyl-tripeptide--D-alanyl-D-alanine ligase [Candidatus Ecksteinia adelgidicola]|nr:UDP-N-acetylmuramoyl-tripeptide--D-alanyl-D-alanine ligase [Candidatus Ecksteinia adelgidicola]